jgi:hypothetical protein
LRVTGSPTPVKHLLAESGIYNSVVGSALDQAQKSSGDSNDVSLSDPAIKKAAKESFTPQVVQQSSEKAINGVYDWLNGKTTQPEFNVDLTNVKATFAEKVGKAAEERAATLPTCTTAPTSTDPFSVTCLPRGVTPAQIGAQAKNDVLSSQGFLEHPNITADSIKNSDTNQSVFNGQLKDAPKQYQRVKKTPYILAILTILTTVGIVFLSVSRRQGIKHVGRILITTGLIMLVFAWVLNRVAIHNVIPKMQLDNKVLQADIQKMSTDLVHNIDQNYVAFGGTYAVLGILAIAGALWIGRNPKSAAPTATESPESAPGIAHPQQKSKRPPKIQG